MEPSDFPPPAAATRVPDPGPGATTPTEPFVGAPYGSLLYLPDPRVRWGLGAAVLTILGIVAPLGLLILLVGFGVVPPSPGLIFAGSLGSYLVSLLVPVLATRLRGLGSLAADLGLRFRWIDVPIGIGIGIGVRIVIFAAIIPLSPYLGGAQGNMAIEEDPLWFVLSTVLIPVVVAPLVEEVLCRGMVMRAVRNRMLRGRAVPSAARRSAAYVLSIALSTLVFAALHGHQMVNAATVITLGATTVIAGVAHGWIATATGRLGAAIISHATLNGSAVLLLVVVQAFDLA